MTSTNRGFFITFLFLVGIAIGGAGCDTSGVVSTGVQEPQTEPPTVPAPVVPAPVQTTTAPITGSASLNVMQVTVNGSFCSASTTTDIGYYNKPCASITICQPGSATNCQTVSDVLIDTGSYGLRVFPTGTNANGTSYNLNTLDLPAVTQSGASVGTCAQFLDGSALWGSVARADVVLATGGERASSIPIELINSSFGGAAPADCDDGSAAVNAADAGFNGILGVGLWAQDCGTDCDPAYEGSIASAGITTAYYPYYTCNGNTCTQALVSLANQVTNPISAFPVNNNGLIFELPALGAAGATSVNGSIIFGIGTGGNANNVLATTAKTFTADEIAYIATLYNGVTYSDTNPTASIAGSFIDSGSNTYFFTPVSSLVCCSQDANGNVLTTTVACTSSSSSGWMCPASTYSGSGTVEGAAYSTGTPNAATATATPFSVGNFYTLASSGAMAFSNMADADSSCTAANPCVFDWGLPFFFGKNVYVGFQKKSGTTLVTQPFWAY